jgi:hypothetical protein
VARPASSEVEDICADAALTDPADAATSESIERNWSDIALKDEIEAMTRSRIASTATTTWPSSSRVVASIWMV